MPCYNSFPYRTDVTHWRNFTLHLLNRVWLCRYLLTLRWLYDCLWISLLKILANYSIDFSIMTNNRSPLVLVPRRGSLTIAMMTTLVTQRFLYLSLSIVHFVCKVMCSSLRFLCSYVLSKNHLSAWMHAPLLWLGWKYRGFCLTVSMERRRRFEEVISIYCIVISWWFRALKHIFVDACLSFNTLLRLLKHHSYR